MGVQRQPPVGSEVPRQRDKVLVIGAGVGGLACAIDLARQGCRVEVVESAATPGGKLRETTVAGRPIDAGPTVFTMRWVFDELFADAGTSLDDQLSLRPAEILARHAWSRDERLDLHADIDTSVDAIAAFSSPAEAQRYRAFCARAASVYRTLEMPFLRASRPNPLSLTTRVGWRGLPGLMRIDPFSTLWSSLCHQFRDPRLRQLFGRYATYCGSSPFAAPATLMLVAHVEQQGVWLVEGGMHRIARVMAALAERVGASVRLGANVEEIVVRDGRAAGVMVRRADGESEFVAADAVVFNGDAAALGAGLLGTGARAAAGRAAPSTRSLSAITWSMVGRTDGFELQRHNVFFGAHYRAEFEEIFARGSVPLDPTVYVCAQDRHDGGHDASAERLFCLINAPALADSAPLSAQEVERCRHRMMKVLGRCGLAIETDPSSMVTTTPSDFERLFPGSGGAIYGQASHGWKASFSRPGARSAIPNLYLAGGTVHPGPGVPMAALSGRQAATSLLLDRSKDRASTARSLRPATRGGMSMP